ncbi:MAG TPA: hypothetical protein PLH91_01200 [Tenuifilaceae bacterium]|nr:hypothetical protein [Tenuifilaceae bacterium]HPI43821.1 hypothetical protein [Tenuifilaceae bacterium]HPN21323.1 hypothetical protein [Tenuifilaceae bacterium]HPV56817.1 hypothetical protein [Tenuifilaceae bacterium]
MKKSLFTLVLMMLTIALYSQEPPSSFALSLKVDYNSQVQDSQTLVDLSLNLKLRHS